MQFNSIQYLAFLPIIVFLYFLTPFKFRWLLLLVASYYFYMCWKAEYVVLIITTTLINYLLAFKISVSRDRTKQLYLIISLFVSLAPLFTFKYFNFINNSFGIIFSSFNYLYKIPNINVLLPIGISFYTFQTMSYCIDVFFGNKKPERHFGIFALYVSFFPQLVAGPIERSTWLLPQLRKKCEFDVIKVKSGLKLVIRGLFKKIIIADQLALIVDKVYDSPASYSGLVLCIATYAFAVQIYCDFSGYSDIAIGSARIMGFSLTENFKRPYFSSSISEFWKRWHITLSSWFRDYLYIPLGGNRISLKRTSINVFIVFLIAGLWHGASWTFVIWGVIHGFYLLLSQWLRRYNTIYSYLFCLKTYPSAIKWLKVIITFNLVCFAWVFFRANNINDALYICFNLLNFSLPTLRIQEIYSSIELLVLIASLLTLLFNSFIKEMGFVLKPLTKRVIKYVAYSFMINILILFWSNEGNFIYFQF